MKGKWDISDTSLNDDLNKIETDLIEMENNVYKALHDFVEKMPECESAKADDGRSNYHNATEFWKGISKEGDEPSLDDLIEYISNNYHEGMDKETTDLMTELARVRTSVLEVCKESAESILANQEELIKENAEIIKKEKETLKNAEEKLEELKEEKIDLESKKKKCTDGSKEMEDIEIDLEKNTEKIKSIEEKIAKLTVGENSIEIHENEQAKFKRQLSKNKQKLLELTKKHGIIVKGPQNQQNNNSGNYNIQNGNYSMGQQVIEEDQKTDETQIKPINSKRAAKNMINNFINQSDQIEMLDGMGYGDIAAMIQFLGPLDRRKLINLLENRAEELNINEDPLDNLINNISDIDDFIKNYADKTPNEITEFENTMQGIKYAVLLQDARRGSLRRNFSRIFKKEDNRVNYAKQLLRKYADNKAQRQVKRAGFLDNLRENVGKPKLNRKSEIHRAKTDGRDVLQQRGVPEK